MPHIMCEIKHTCALKFLIEIWKLPNINVKCLSKMPRLDRNQGEEDSHDLSSDSLGHSRYFFDLWIINYDRLNINFQIDWFTQHRLSLSSDKFWVDNINEMPSQLQDYYLLFMLWRKLSCLQLIKSCQLKYQLQHDISYFIQKSLSGKKPFIILKLEFPNSKIKSSRVNSW